MQPMRGGFTVQGLPNDRQTFPFLYEPLHWTENSNRFLKLVIIKLGDNITTYYPFPSQSLL